MGLTGIVWATVITYLLDKVVAVIWLWQRRQIGLDSYCHWKWLLAYSSMLLAVYFIIEYTVFEKIIECFEEVEHKISSTDFNLSSNEVLEVLRPHFERIKYKVEISKKEKDKILELYSLDYDKKCYVLKETK